MDYDAQLKLQALLDGELPEAEASEVANWLARDREAAALLEELRNTREALAGFEAGDPTAGVARVLLVEGRAGDSALGDPGAEARPDVAIAPCCAGSWSPLPPSRWSLVAGLVLTRPAGLVRPHRRRRDRDRAGRRGGVYLPRLFGRHDFGLALVSRR